VRADGTPIDGGTGTDGTGMDGTGTDGTGTDMSTAGAAGTGIDPVGAPGAGTTPVEAAVVRAAPAAPAAPADAAGAAGAPVSVAGEQERDRAAGRGAAPQPAPPRCRPPRPRGTLPRTAVLVRHNTAVLLHEPGPLLGRLVMPLLVLLALRPLYRAAVGPDGTTQAVVGSLVTFSLLALSIVGTSILSERAWRTWDRVRCTPVRPAELLAGKAVPVFAVLAVQQAVVLGFGVVVLGMPVASPGLLVAGCAAWALALLGMGAAAGLLAGSYGQLSAMLDIGAFCLTTLGGALVPESTLPGWVRAVSPLSPGYWAADVLRHAAAGDAPRTVADIGVLLLVAAAGAAVAAWRINRGWGRAVAV
jgi:ABC-2 type transport system permease protein